jgi:hypothetical protein
VEDTRRVGEENVKALWILVSGKEEFHAVSPK